MGECDVCLYGDDDFEGNDFFAQRTVRARKEHVCCECRGGIHVGESYEVSTGKSDGQCWTYRTCALCMEVRTVFHCGGAYLFTTLWDDMAEQAFPRLTTASPCFHALSVAAKGLVMDRWRAYRKLA